ncbi:MAG: DUF4364 family protein [Oscillospiraceae bacterium]|jgi:hypothetical protein|nr:DUF4364 family protein [Oscillospiraceae bacterium]
MELLIELRDVDIIKVLICYVLYKIEMPAADSQLREVIVGSGAVNYFFYTDALDGLVRHNSISVDLQNGENVYTLEEKGRLCAETLKSHVPKLFRDRVIEKAVRYFTKVRNRENITVEYEKAGNGYTVVFKCNDNVNDLIDLKFFAPDEKQAKLLSDNIERNPLGFYTDLIALALHNKDIEVDLTDN